MSERVAIYAGSFDPPTNGHLWMIERGAELFDRLIVAIGTNPAKKGMFTVAERMEMLEKATVRLFNVRVSEFTNKYLIHYAKSLGARFILRGIRNATDQEFERMLQKRPLRNSHAIRSVRESVNVVKYSYNLLILTHLCSHKILQRRLCFRLLCPIKADEGQGRF